MEGPQPGLRREGFQRGLLGVVLVEEVNDFGDALELIHGFILDWFRLGSHPILAQGLGSDITGL